MIGIVDYGLGNLDAFTNIYRRLGIDAQRVAQPEHLSASMMLILPGVGAFDWAMTKLNASGLRDALDEAVLERRLPVLGICVGMQMMFGRSEEGTAEGLGWIDGEIVRLSHHSAALPLPHMGWNDVTPRAGEILFDGLDGPRFYFLHSYGVSPRLRSGVIAETEYGGVLPCAIRQGSIAGVQFHPEKSHGWGVGLLKNFATKTAR